VSATTHYQEEPCDSRLHSSATPDEPETTEIASISGNTVTLAAPLQYSHTPAPRTPFLVADETRNVTIETASGTAPDQQAHVMEMHNDAVSIAYAAFDHLGRTDKSIPLANGSPTTGPGLNQVGRYALHFHRCAYPGLTDNDPPIKVVGCFEMGSPGWGYDNHSSNVDFEDDVAFDNFGAGFATEAGNEIGTFNQCYAVRSTGVLLCGGATGFNNSASMGVDGEGFWLQSPAVAVTNDVATDCQIGFTEWSLPLGEKGLNDNLYIPWLPNASSYPAYLKGYVGVNNVPFTNFVGDIASFATEGLEVNWNCQGNYGLFSTVNAFTASYVTDGVHGLKYANGVTVQNSTFLAYPGEPATGAPSRYIGVNSGPAYTASWRFVNLNVQGFTIGAVPSNTGTDFIQGGYYNNHTNFYIFHGFPGTVYNFSGLRFGPTSQMDYYLSPASNIPWQGGSSPVQVFVDGQELYWPDQTASAVPFPTANPNLPPQLKIPPQLIGLTWQQIYNQYGLTPEGALTPATATGASWTNGLVGPAQSMPDYYTLLSRVSAPVTAPYTLKYWLYANGGQSHFTYPTPFILLPGWNAITLVLNGQKTTFFVFGTVPVLAPA
jgi:hypothetical protein